MSKQPGLSLADISAQTADVQIGDNVIRVHGISAGKALEIFKRFPTLGKMLGGEFKASDILGSMPEAVAAIIAASVGGLGDPAQEEYAANIPMETQFDLLEAIGGLTFKIGFGPFARRIMALADKADFESFTKVPAMKLPLESKPSSQPDIPQA
jgi:hypothetical protein